MKVRIWCRLHRRWHSKHAHVHCGSLNSMKKGSCTRKEHCTLQKEGR